MSRQQWTEIDGPHQGQKLETAGAPLATAEAAVVFVHGRGATARSIIALGDELRQHTAEKVRLEGTTLEPSDSPFHTIAFLAPQAQRNTWYPNSFLAPVESNEPGRSSGLRAISDAIYEANDAGIPTDRVALVGFSQGACLASEFVARAPTRYGGLAALSGGLIGSDIDPDTYTGSLEGTPVFFGCSDVDPHIPLARVHETTTVFERLDADVTERIYEGMGHGINEDEAEFVSGMLTELGAGSGGEGR